MGKRVWRSLRIDAILPPMPALYSKAVAPPRARIPLYVLCMTLPIVMAVTSACGGHPGGEVTPYPAPPFALQDLNPASSTYLETLSTGDASGEVLVLYFASFT